METNITKEDFAKKVYDIKNIETEDDLKLIGNNPVVIDFYAPWCGPCKMLEPIFEEVSEEYKSKVDFYKVDTESALDVAVKFGVRSLPTLLYIPTKGEPEMSPGNPPEATLKYMLDGLIEKSKGE